MRRAADADGFGLREERLAHGVGAARKASALLAAGLSMTTTVHGRDAAGEFIYGVMGSPTGQPRRLIR